MASDHSQQTDRRPAWTFVIVAAALFMVVLDNLVVTTALPSIQAELGATIQSLEWTVNAYTLTYAVLLLTGAALGDRFGRRRMFVIGLGIFTLASAAAALAPTTARADRRAGRPGRRRRDRDPADAHPARRRVPAREARAGDRRVVRRVGSRRRARPADRRRGRRRHLVALDLLDQRPGRARRHPAGATQAGREPRAARGRSTCPASRSPAPACSGSSTASSAAPSSAGRARPCSAR